MNAHLESLEYKSEIKNAWIAATEAYNKSNGGHTTHRNLLCGKQQDRDKNLLDKRYELLSETVFKGLFPPGTLHLYFVMAANSEGKRYQGTTICDKYKHDTTPDTVIVDVLIYDKPETQCNDTRMKWLTGTLLHELVHAVVDVYTCACQRCKESSVEAEGLTGHGPVWMGISLKVEKTMQQIFGYRCWLGRTQSLAIEHHASQHRHSEKELRAHGVNEGFIANRGLLVEKLSLIKEFLLTEIILLRRRVMESWILRRS
ncbi:hypothetical protein ACEPPN_017536 [Leptodophora sp. 'Broadleaf-Isolate-01']